MLSRADNETLTRVGPGIPMGDLFRGFWLPALMPSELPSPDCPPVGIRLVGEELGGRTVHLHPQEALLQAARAFQTSPAFAEYRRLRQAAEHRIARLVQLGIRQARYFGRAKTLFQLCNGCGGGQSHLAGLPGCSRNQRPRLAASFCPHNGGGRALHLVDAGQLLEPYYLA